MAVSNNDAFELLLQLAPPRFRRWMGTETSDATGKALRALAQGFKAYGYDVLDQLRRELHAQEMVERLPAWEGLLGLTNSRVARFGTLSQRRAQIIARRRERGTPTKAAVTASLAAFGAPGAEFIEHGRASLKGINTRGFGTTTATVGNTATITQVVGDNAPASSMGAQLIYNITGTQGAFDVTLTAPDARAKTWRSLVIADGADHVLFWPEYAGGPISGTWTLQIDNSIGGVADVQVDRADLFIEGIGRAASGAEGYGALIFEWSAAINEGTVDATKYDRAAAIATAERWDQAHTRGGVALYQTDGSLSALGDDDNCIGDLVVGD